MKKPTAVVSFAVVCLLIAGGLLARLFTPEVGAGVFALSLLIFGTVSRGFRRHHKRDRESGRSNGADAG